MKTILFTESLDELQFFEKLYEQNTLNRYYALEITTKSKNVDGAK